MTDMTVDLKRLLASRKAHTGIVTRKSIDFESIKKSPEEVTADDILAETIVDTMTDKLAEFGEINLDEVVLRMCESINLNGGFAIKGWYKPSLDEEGAANDLKKLQLSFPAC